MIAPELPNNLDAETAVLAACLTNRDAIIPLDGVLSSDDFYSQAHGWVYDAILACWRRREPPDLITVKTELEARERLDKIGGLGALLRLSESILPTSYHVEYYAKLVLRAAGNRKLIDAGTKIAAIGYQNLETEAALGNAEQQLAQIALRHKAAGLRSSSEAADREYSRIDAANRGESSATAGAQTGFRDLDEITRGLLPSDFLILAARPSIGKTAFMLSMAHGLAKYAPDYDVLIFSLEMSEEALRWRRLSMLSGIDGGRVQSLRMNEQELAAYMDALGCLSEMPVYVDDTPAATVSYVRGMAYRHQAQYSRPLVIMVDYLQLMTAQGEHLDNRVQAVSEISRSLKALARELKCPVLALSQLSRAVESRESKVPMLSDLRESGGLEQDADIVMFLYREEVYDKNTDKKGIAELHIAKHRNGPIGVVPLVFNAAITRFDTLTYREMPNY